MSSSRMILLAKTSDIDTKKYVVTTNATFLSRATESAPPSCPKRQTDRQKEEGEKERRTNEASCFGGGSGTGVEEGREGSSGSGRCALVAWERVSGASPSSALSDMSVCDVVSEDDRRNGGQSGEKTSNAWLQKRHPAPSPVPALSSLFSSPWLASDRAVQNASCLGVDHNLDHHLDHNKEDIAGCWRGLDRPSPDHTRSHQITLIKVERRRGGDLRATSFSIVVRML